MRQVNKNPFWQTRRVALLLSDAMLSLSRSARNLPGAWFRLESLADNGPRGVADKVVLAGFAAIHECSGFSGNFNFGDNRNKMPLQPEAF